MAAPKGKKAKLAHEKRTAEQEVKGQFLIKAVHERVTDASGRAGVVVDIDDKGTKAVVDPVFVLQGADGTLTAREIACPALYDAVARERAIERFASLSEA